MAKHSGESAIKKQARRWFSVNAHWFDNLTEAAENCAWALDHDEWLDDPDHWVWELAIEYMPERNPGVAQESTRRLVRELQARLLTLESKYHQLHRKPPTKANVKLKYAVWEEMRAVGERLEWLKEQYGIPVTNPAEEPAVPRAVESFVEYIWREFEKARPDDDDINPVVVEPKPVRVGPVVATAWEISFDEGYAREYYDVSYVYYPPDVCAYWGHTPQQCWAVGRRGPGNDVVYSGGLTKEIVRKHVRSLFSYDPPWPNPAEEDHPLWGSAGPASYAASMVDELTQELRHVDGKIYWLTVGKPLTPESEQELLLKRTELLRLITSWERAAARL